VRAELAASIRKEFLVGVRSWRVLAYSLFLAAVILLGAYLPPDSFPYELSLSQGPLVILVVLGCAFIFAIDSVSREHERGTAPLVFGTQASRGVLLGAKALVPLAAWLVTLAALAAAYLTQGMGPQFAWQWLATLGCATLLFLAVLALMLLVSAAVRGRGAAFAGLVVVMFIFFSSGYIPLGLAGGVRWLSPGYHDYLMVTDIGDGALDSPLPLVALVAESMVFMLLAYWAFRRSEVSR
jgi:ABC-type transport system involved in multi-copper enzyme maturation permease subunit